VKRYHYSLTACNNVETARKNPHRYSEARGKSLPLCFYNVILSLSEESHVFSFRIKN